MMSVIYLLSREHRGNRHQINLACQRLHLQCVSCPTYSQMSAFDHREIGQLVDWFIRDGEGGWEEACFH